MNMNIITGHKELYQPLICPTQRKKESTNTQYKADNTNTIIATPQT